MPLADLEATCLGFARDIVQIERKNPGYIRLNKMVINYRHQELMLYTTINPMSPSRRPSRPSSSPR